MARIKLTSENYYSKEANIDYMSASQYKAFRKCEAAAMAELSGEIERKNTAALSVGSFIDAYFSGEMEQFKAQNPGIFTKKEELRAEYIKAMEAAKRIERDELARMLISGRHQVIKTGKIGGVWFKSKYDSLLSSNAVENICKKFPAVRALVPFGGAMIVDLKYMKDFDDIYDDDMGEYVNFIEYWGYNYQGAIYQAIDKRHAPFVILGVTKDDTPDLNAFYVPDEDLADCIAEIETNAPRYDAIKKGKTAPTGCGKCAYCRSQKKLDEIIYYRYV